MSLVSGQALLHYRLVEQIGEGGMGVVWKAVDTNLDREVAIKVLPETFARDPERLARFQREARLLAGLNHPNIATVHGLHEVDTSTGSVRFLAMELIAGQDLSRHIENGALPVERAVEIGRQIAEALEVAHENGIIHRDLKPANVLITPEGQAKVLDFGLAKSAAGSGDPDISMSPTMTSAGTQAGMIMGTAAYLSPEQAKGNVVDRRTDIWAFGVVMHEMLSGERTFRGDGLSETLAAVILKEPDLAVLPRDTPPRVRELVRRCLVKDPRKRLRDIGEARVCLEDPDAVAVTPPAPEGAATDSAPPSRGRAWLALAALPVFGIAGILVGRMLAPAPPPSEPVRLAVELSEEPFSDVPGMAVVPSPNGRYIAFLVGEPSQLYVRSMQNLEAKAVSDTQDARQPFFSPDGEWIGFFANGKLKKVSVHGGTPLTLADSSSGRGGTWTADDTIVYAPKTTTGLHRISAAGGDPVPITTPEDDENHHERSHRWPHALPDGRSVLFIVQERGKGYADATIELLDLDTLERSVIHAGGSYPRYVPGGFLAFVRAGTVFAARFDPDAGVIARSPVPVLEGIRFSSGNGAADIALTGDGTLFHMSGTSSRQWVGKIGFLDADGSFSEWSIDPSKLRDATLSPDGRRVAFTVTDPEENIYNIWIYDLDRDVATRLTFAEARDWYPSWTPDGAYITFSSDRTGGMEVYRKRADGSGDAELLMRDRGAAWGGGTWSPDGKHFAFHDRVQSNDLFILDTSADADPSVFLSTDASEAFPKFSPDGKWIAYVSDESGRREAYVRPFPGPRGKWQISRDGADATEWSRDGRRLFLEGLDNTIRYVEIEADGPSLQVGRPVVFARSDYEVAGRWSVAADGTVAVAQMIAEESPTVDRGVVTVVFDWPTELERLVPHQP